MKNKYKILTLIVLIIGGVVISLKLFNIRLNEVQAKKMIQQEEFIPNENYQNLTEELILTNDNENFLINGEVVPEEIRVPKGSNLTVNVKNASDFATSLHFHGINGLSKMDGVGGVSQENIQPGESFEYKFILDEPGTYMYHSHVDSQKQVNNENLYGGLVVEDGEKTNQDMLLFNTNINEADQYNSPNLSYTQVYVNGETEELKKIDNDENIFLNIASISSAPISINFGENIKYRFTSIDANPATSDWQENQAVIVPTAQRFTLEIENPKHSFQIATSIKNINNATYNLQYKNDTKIPEHEIKENNNVILNTSSSMSGQEYTNLEDGAKHIYDMVQTKKSLDIKEADVDKKFNMALSMGSGMWTIDEKAYPNTKNIEVEEGDNVEITLANNSHMSTTHPFHLHGHKFEVISINNENLAKPLVLDTIDVRPNSIVKIRLKADNPGIWAFHCHNLNHAALGMMTLFTYKGYETEVSSGAGE